MCSGACVPVCPRVTLLVLLLVALDEILRDMDESGSGTLRMFRLLQGDVGSGKTAVAFLAMLKAAEQGAQSCLLAPTELLTMQHLQVRHVTEKHSSGARGERERIHVSSINISCLQSRHRFVWSKREMGLLCLLLDLDLESPSLVRLPLERLTQHYDYRVTETDIHLTCLVFHPPSCCIRRFGPWRNKSSA